MKRKSAKRWLVKNNFRLARDRIFGGYKKKDLRQINICIKALGDKK